MQPCITLNWQTPPSRAEVVSLVQHCKPVSWYQCVHTSDMSEYIWMKNLLGKVSIGERMHKKSHKTLWKNLEWCKMYYVTRWLSTNIINLRKYIFFFLDRNAVNTWLLFAQHKSLSVWSCSEFISGTLLWVGTFTTCQQSSTVLLISTLLGSNAE